MSKRKRRVAYMPIDECWDCKYSSVKEASIHFRSRCWMKCRHPDKKSPNAFLPQHSISSACPLRTAIEVVDE